MRIAVPGDPAIDMDAMGGIPGFHAWVTNGCDPSELKLKDGEQPTYLNLIPMTYRQRLRYEEMTGIERGLFATRCMLRGVENFTDHDERGQIRESNTPIVENTADYGPMVSLAWINRVELPIEFIRWIDTAAPVISAPSAPLSKGSDLPSGAIGSK